MKWLISILLLLVSLTASAETQIQLRRGTASQWAAANPTLTAAEIGVDLTNNSFRVGDGSTAWSDLPEYSVTEAPEDEAVYVRQDGEWAALMVEDVDLAADVTGVLPISNGGTGQTSLPAAAITSAQISQWTLQASAKTFEASESLGVGQLVNLYDDAGVVKARLADASAIGTQAHGFVLSQVTLGSCETLCLTACPDEDPVVCDQYCADECADYQYNVGVYFSRGAVISGLSALTPGAQYYLSETAGEITATAPTTIGSIVQPIGIAISDTELLFLPGEAVVQ